MFIKSKSGPMLMAFAIVKDLKDDIVNGVVYQGYDINKLIVLRKQGQYEYDAAKLDLKNPFVSWLFEFENETNLNKSPTPIGRLELTQFDNHWPVRNYYISAKEGNYRIKLSDENLQDMRSVGIGMVPEAIVKNVFNRILSNAIS